MIQRYLSLFNINVPTSGKYLIGNDELIIDSVGDESAPTIKEFCISRGIVIDSSTIGINRTGLSLDRINVGGNLFLVLTLGNLIINFRIVYSSKRDELNYSNLSIGNLGLSNMGRIEPADTIEWKFISKFVNSVKLHLERFEHEIEK